MKTSTRISKLRAQDDDRPAYKRIKDHLLAGIQSGQWKQGDLIPSEHALAEEFGVARMTANRAVRELSDERVLVRMQGSGTYVAQPKYEATLVEIRNIAEEVRARGHAHRSELHRLERTRADAQLASEFKVDSGASLFHSVVVHLENDVPIQVEDRYVNPEVAPRYMQLDFTRATANEHLMEVAPLSGVAYSIEARMPTEEIASMLNIAQDAPCLVLCRNTQSQGIVASVATLWHPGAYYQFTGRF
jgi:GntR family histidine utilization transcriptional repressor